MEKNHKTMLKILEFVKSKVSVLRDECDRAKLEVCETD